MAHYVVAAVIDAEERNHQERVRLRSLRDASNPFYLAEPKFRKLFRIPNTSALYLCEELEEYARFNEYDNIPKHIKILGALHFFGHGGYQTEDGGESLISLSQPSMSRAIEETTNAIVDLLAPRIIKFPTTVEEKQRTMRERFIWNFFRLENEHLNNCGKFRAVRDISVAPLDSSDQADIIKMMDHPDGVVNRLAKKKNAKKGKESDKKPLLVKESIHDLQLELDLSSKML